MFVIPWWNSAFLVYFQNIIYNQGRNLNPFQEHIGERQRISRWMLTDIMSADWHILLEEYFGSTEDSAADVHKLDTFSGTVTEFSFSANHRFNVTDLSSDKQTVGLLLHLFDVWTKIPYVRCD